VKNDNETVPEVSAAKIVDGSMPLPGAGAKAGVKQDLGAQKGASRMRRLVRSGTARHSQRHPVRRQVRQPAGQAFRGNSGRQTRTLDRLRGMLPVGKK